HALHVKRTIYLAKTQIATDTLHSCVAADVPDFEISTDAAHFYIAADVTDCAGATNTVHSRLAVDVTDFERATDTADSEINASRQLEYYVVVDLNVLSLALIRL